MYRVLFFTGIFFLLGLFPACIERYYPEGEEFRQGTLVVIAHLDDSEEEQSVYISRSTTLEFPNREPLSGCIVEIEDIEGNSWELPENEPGAYRDLMPDLFLRNGEQYRLLLLTPDGNSYESEFEELHPAPAIDSLYWEREDIPMEEAGMVTEGIRFFLDFQIIKDDSPYLRWQLVETYEMHNPDYQSTEMYDTDRRFKPIPPELDNPVCWINQEVPDIYTMDLGRVDGEIYRAMPLNFVSNTTQRLQYRYSILLRQFAVSQSAFWYWDGLKNNLQSNGGLFDSQPSLNPGNICNTNDEEEIIIGYFSVSGVSEKRIFVSEVAGLPIIPDPGFCEPGGLPKNFWRLTQAFLPYYIATTESEEGGSHRGNVNTSCIDCREHPFSTNIPPDFW